MFITLFLVPQCPACPLGGLSLLYPSLELPRLVCPQWRAATLGLLASGSRSWTVVLAPPLSSPSWIGLGPGISSAFLGPWI